MHRHIPINSYGTKSGTTPYIRWANDRLLRYVDKTKAARINERFGLRLPDILKNPSLAPNAQIHGMGRGNTKDLRLGIILTEKIGNAAEKIISQSNTTPAKQNH